LTPRATVARIVNGEANAERRLTAIGGPALKKFLIPPNLVGFTASPLNHSRGARHMKARGLGGGG
jgi:hypothetical protein